MHALFCLYLPYLTSFAHIVYRLVYTVLLTVCLFYSMCNSVLFVRVELLCFILVRVAVVNENLFSTGLPGLNKGEIKKKQIKLRGTV